MARIAGVDLPRNKHVNIALTYIYGIGNPRAAHILDQANVEPMKSGNWMPQTTAVSVSVAPLCTRVLRTHCLMTPLPGARMMA